MRSMLFEIVAIVIVLTFGAWLGVMRWNECRRIHPFWYCASAR